MIFSQWSKNNSHLSNLPSDAFLFWWLQPGLAEVALLAANLFAAICKTTSTTLHTIMFFSPHKTNLTQISIPLHVVKWLSLFFGVALITIVKLYYSKHEIYQILFLFVHSVWTSCSLAAAVSVLASLTGSLYLVCLRLCGSQSKVPIHPWYIAAKFFAFGFFVAVLLVLFLETKQEQRLPDECVFLWAVLILLLTKVDEMDSSTPRIPAKQSPEQGETSTTWNAITISLFLWCLMLGSGMTSLVLPVYSAYLVVHLVVLGPDCTKRFRRALRKHDDGDLNLPTWTEQSFALGALQRELSFLRTNMEADD